MNKQELIQALKEHIDLVTMPLTGNSYERGKMVGFETSLSLVAKLDEPQKIKVPEFVAKWFETNKYVLDRAILDYMFEDYASDDSEFGKWFDNKNGKPIETLVRMLDGYEVEEEPKWVVKVGNLYFCGWEDTTAQFVMNTVLGEDESIIKYKNEGTASSVAKNLGGTVEKV